MNALARDECMLAPKRPLLSTSETTSRAKG
jgi:hypothetical protein